MIKKSISLLLCSALVFTASLGLPAASYAATGSGDLTAVKEVSYGYRSVPETSYYSDDFFKTNSYLYDRQLASMSFDLGTRSCICSRYYDDEDIYVSMSRNLRDYLLDNGFTDFEISDAYKSKPTVEGAAVACAHKKISDKGKDYTLLVIQPKGGATELEWVNAERVSKESRDTGNFAGYEYLKNEVLKFASEYIRTHGISGDIKVWTAGYSRGAGIVNLMGADLIDDPQAALGSSIRLAPEDLYCYCFGTPSAAGPYAAAPIFPISRRSPSKWPSSRVFP